MLVSTKIAILVPLVLFVCSYIYQEQESVAGSLFRLYNKEDILLVVGILSAPQNWDKRKSIRDTWTKLLTNSDVKYYFLVGKRVCPIHPVDRKSNLSCEELDISWPKEHLHHPLNWTSHTLQQSTSKGAVPIVTSFTFRINYPVVLHRIKVLSSVIVALTGARIEFKDARTGYNFMTKEIHVGKDFSAHNWILVALEPFVLPKGYDMLIELLPLNSKTMNKCDKSLCTGESVWFDFYGAIEYSTQYSPESGTVPFSNYSCTPVSLELELHDFETNLGKIENRRQEWSIEQETLHSNIINEANMEKDILLLDIIDVYKNLPVKMLLFYQWVNENIDPAFVLKTDDDTFVDVSSIDKFLRHTKAKAVSQSQPYLWWWAKLRYGLPVDRFGKWQELKYRAPVYPPFPCGSGYVLSQDTIKFLASNTKSLHPFQGEDTSLGIWLSGVLPAEPSDSTCEWTCDNTCSFRACNRGQLTTSDMYVVWDLYQRCQNMCGCDSDADIIDNTSNIRQYLCALLPLLIEHSARNELLSLMKWISNNLQEHQSHFSNEK